MWDTGKKKRNNQTQLVSFKSVQKKKIKVGNRYCKGDIEDQMTKKELKIPRLGILEIL